MLEYSTKMSKAYYIQIPSKVAVILPGWEISPPFKGFNINKCRLLLSIIATHQRKDDNGNTYAVLKAEYLNNFIYDFEKYIELLTGSNIIEKFGGYVVGDHSWKYRFSKSVQSPYLRSELKDQKLINKIYKVRADMGRKDSRKYPKQNQIIKSMTIDVDRAEEISKEHYPEDIEALNYSLGAINRIKNKEFYHRVDGTGKRLHTNLTNLPKILKGMIKIKGEYISGVEIRNSQPYIASKILSDPESVRPFFPSKTIDGYDQFPYMMLKSLRLSEQKDVILFHLLVSQARLYKYLETEFNKRGCNYEIQKNPDKVSPDLKIKMFQIFFDENHHTSREKKIFHELFPSVNKAWSILRMADYRDFNTCLTRMESYVVLDVIIKRLNNEFPHINATPIYDNVCSSDNRKAPASIAASNTKVVCQVMKEELTKFIGLSPKLEIEEFKR